MSRKKNIVFIQCDSMDGRFMGCMKHPALIRATPNIDKLASEGVLFRNSYSNNSICCPSRSSMWSGQYTHHCEGWNNYKGLSEDTPTFQTALKDSGYRTVTFGKTDYLSGNHTVRARVSPWTRAANIRKPNYRLGSPVIYDNEETKIKKTDWKNIGKSIEWLNETVAGDSRPFMMYLGLYAPHPEFITSKAYLDLIEESGIDVPPEDIEDHPFMEYQRINKNWEHGYSEETIRKVRRIYCAMVAEVDAMVGKIISTLEALNILDSTYIIFTSDHGEMAMEHRQFYKMSLYEPSVRVPLIIKGPDLPKGKEVEELVSLVDIFPTLMDLAETEHPAGLDGHSLLPLMYDKDRNRPDWVFSECHDSSCNTGSFMLRRGDWKYNVYVGYPSQLFNLREDPHEICNLAETRQDIVKEMDGILRSFINYEAVDAKVKAYDRESFRTWRENQIQEGTYETIMGLVYSGFDNVPVNEIIPWSEEDERLILEWLERG